MKENINLLVVEDDSDINGLLYKILKKQGYEVRCAFSGTEALMCLEQYDYDIVLLDLMLPGISGEELIAKIRKDKTMPIIIISAKIGQDTKVQALKLGADDFVSKPFDVSEVVARVEAQLRRYIVFSGNNDNKGILKYKGITLNSDTREVFVNSEEIALTVREFCILELLMTYPKKVFTKANLYENVWNDTFIGDDNTLNVHISNLRSKIAKIDSANDYIQTVWGIGFKMHE